MENLELITRGGLLLASSLIINGLGAYLRRESFKDDIEENCPLFKDSWQIPSYLPDLS